MTLEDVHGKTVREIFRSRKRIVILFTDGTKLKLKIEDRLDDRAWYSAALIAYLNGTEIR